MRSFIDLFSALGFSGNTAFGSLFIILVLLNGAVLLTRGREEEQPPRLAGRDAQIRSFPSAR